MTPLKWVQSIFEGENGRVEVTHMSSTLVILRRASRACHIPSFCICLQFAWIGIILYNNVKVYIIHHALYRRLDG